MEKTVLINGIEYIPKEQKTEGLPYVIIRTYSAGVHMGYLNKKESTLAGMEVELINSRRLYSWAGAYTLSDLAMSGTAFPEKCKFTQEVNSICLLAIEIIPVSKIGFNSLTSVNIWKL